MDFFMDNIFISAGLSTFFLIVGILAMILELNFPE